MTSDGERIRKKNLQTDWKESGSWCSKEYILNAMLLAKTVSASACFLSSVHVQTYKKELFKIKKIQSPPPTRGQALRQIRYEAQNPGNLSLLQTRFLLYEASVLYTSSMRNDMWIFFFLETVTVMWSGAKKKIIANF